MCENKQLKWGRHTFSVTIYSNHNKWYLPFGLAWWNRHATNSLVYYTHLVEVSVGILCVRLQFQWWVK